MSADSPSVASGAASVSTRRDVVARLLRFPLRPAPTRLDEQAHRQRHSRSPWPLSLLPRGCSAAVRRDPGDPHDPAAATVAS